MKKQITFNNIDVSTAYGNECLWIVTNRESEIEMLDVKRFHLSLADYVILAKCDTAYVSSPIATTNDYSFGKRFVSSTQRFFEKNCSPAPICRLNVWKLLMISITSSWATVTCERVKRYNFNSINWCYADFRGSHNVHLLEHMQII